MQYVPILYRVLKIVSLLVVSAGIGLHVSLQYSSILLTGLVYLALITINVITAWVLFPIHIRKAHTTQLQTTRP